MTGILKYSLAFSACSELATSFATHEHIAIGSSVQVTLNGTTMSGKETLLYFPNGNSWISFADVVALGGDYYGFEAAPITDAVGLPNQMVRFNNSFSTLYFDSDAPLKPDPGFAPSRDFKYQSRQLIIGPDETLSEQIAKATASGKQPSVAYEECGRSLDQRRNVVSGGGSFVSSWIPFGRYVSLAVTNWDHFSYDGRAWSAYAAGHTLALLKAQESHQAALSSSSASLVLARYAYSLEAFALHFLTDAFSSGHMRTPRKKFPEVCTPSDIGSYLSRYQHDEECRYGLNVTNQDGRRWRAYGDKKYLDDVNAVSREVCVACVQKSVDEVGTAMETGVVPANDTLYVASRCVPVPVTDEGENLTPLFKWDDQVHDLIRRDDINDLWSKKFKKHGGLEGWWSTMTLIDLETRYGPPSDLPPFPNRSRLEDLQYW
jgi:hypothetical protein